MIPALRNNPNVDAAMLALAACCHAPRNLNGSGDSAASSVETFPPKGAELD